MHNRDWVTSAYLDGKHGDRAAVNSLYRKTYLFIFFPETKYIKQRQIMLRRRDRQHCVHAKPLVFNDLSIIAFEQQIPHLLFEPHSPVKSLNPIDTPGV